MNLSVNVDKKFVKLIDLIINESKMYSSRSEFLKSAIREKLEKQEELNRRLNLKKTVKEIGLNALNRGWSGKLLTKKEKRKIADEYLKKKGINPKLLAP